MKKFVVPALILMAMIVLFTHVVKRNATRIDQDQVEDLASTSATPRKKSAGPSLESPGKSSASTAGVSAVVTPKESLVKMQSLLECYSSEKCQYPQTDPKSYQIALNKDVADLLKNSQASEFAQDKDMAKVLREFMKEGDGFVQEEVLKLMADLPISEENLQAIIEGMKNNYADPLIMQQVIQELARYNNSSMAEQVRGFVGETLLSGPQYSAEATAQKIRSVLSPDNIPYYRSLAEKSRSSAVKNALQSSLNDYELSLGGG